MNSIMLRRRSLFSLTEKPHTQRIFSVVFSSREVEIESVAKAWTPTRPFALPKQEPSFPRLTGMISVMTFYLRPIMRMI